VPDKHLKSIRAKETPPHLLTPNPVPPSFPHLCWCVLRPPILSAQRP
jgi:hypothetical protein